MATDLPENRHRCHEQRWALVRRKLEEHALALMHQGTLVSKTASGRRVWAVRFVDRSGGGRVHRTIYVGGDDQPHVLDRARQLLESYRVLGRWADNLDTYVRLAAAAKSIVRRTLSGLGVGGPEPQPGGMAGVVTVSSGRGATISCSCDIF